MKILIIHKWLVTGGVEKVLLNYLNIFKLIGYEVELLIKYDLGYGNNSLEDLIPSEINHSYIFKSHFYKKIKSLKSKKGWLYKILRELIKLQEYLLFKRKIKSKIKANRYDLVIDFSECLDKFIRYSNFIKINNIKTIKWIHSQLNTNNLQRNIDIFSKHDKLIAICNQMREIIIQQLNYKNNNISVIFNPIDLTELNRLSKQSVEDSKLINDKYILQVSRLVNGKGHFELLDIYAQLKKMGIKHKLYLIGDGENRANLEHKIKELDLIDDCLLLGEIKNPYPYFKNADLFVHTSESEGLPTVILESMALGIPVVAMDCPTGPKDIIGENNKYGKLIPMHDKDKFIEGVMSLLNNKRIWQYYSKQSLIRIQDFSIEKILLEIDHTLKKIIEKNNLNK